MVVKLAPTTAPALWQKSSSGRLAVIAGSSWRSEPAAAFRGFGEDRLAALGALGVELLEPGALQDDLAADLEALGNLRRLRRRRFSRCGTVLMVFRLTVTSSPVVPSPRVEPTDQPAVLVDELDREPVELRLGDVA